MLNELIISIIYITGIYLHLKITKLHQKVRKKPKASKRYLEAVEMTKRFYEKYKLLVNSQKI